MCFESGFRWWQTKRMNQSRHNWFGWVSSLDNLKVDITMKAHSLHLMPRRGGVKIINWSIFDWIPLHCKIENFWLWRCFQDETQKIPNYFLDLRTARLESKCWYSVMWLVIWHWWIHNCRILFWIYYNPSLVAYWILCVLRLTKTFADSLLKCAFMSTCKQIQEAEWNWHGAFYCFSNAH